MGIAKVNDTETMVAGLRGAFIMSIPLVVVSAFIVRSLLDMTQTSFVLYMIVILQQLVFEYLNVFSDYTVNTDRKVIGRTLYSVFNSILVPSIFLLVSSLDGILLAWNIAMIVPLLYFYRKGDMSALFWSFRVDFSTTFLIIRTGLPIYIGNWFNLIIQRMDILLLYKYLPEGQPAEYYWMLKISTIIREIFYLMVTGLFPLLVVAYKERGREELMRMVHSIMRVALLFGWSLYTFLIAYGRVSITILLSDRFAGGLLVLQLISMGMGMNIPAVVLNSVAGAEGKMKHMMWMNIIADSIWLGCMVLLLPFGATGMAVAFLINKLIQSSYMLLVYRKDFTGVRAFYRILGFVFFSMLLSLVSAYMFLPVYVLILYVTRPLTGSDWSFIARVLPVHRIPVLKQLLVHDSI